MISIETVLSIADAAVFSRTRRRLKDSEVAILKGSWQKHTYEEIALTHGYNAQYLKQDVGPKLWKTLSSGLGEKVSKSSFRTSIERRANSNSSISKLSFSLNKASGLPQRNNGQSDLNHSLRSESIVLNSSQQVQSNFYQDLQKIHADLIDQYSTQQATLQDLLNLAVQHFVKNWSNPEQQSKIVAELLESLSAQSV